MCCTIPELVDSIVKCVPETAWKYLPDNPGFGAPSACAICVTANPETSFGWQRAQGYSAAAVRGAAGTAKAAINVTPQIANPDFPRLIPRPIECPVHPNGTGTF